MAMPRPRKAALPLLLFAALVVVPAVGAHGQEGRWCVGVDGFFVSPNDERVDVGSVPGATYGIDGDGMGFGLALEFRATRRLGFQLELATVDFDVAFRDPTLGAPPAETDAASFDIYLAGVDWHLLPERRLDLTLGVFVAMTKLDDVSFRTAGGDPRKLTFDDDYGFGLAVGVGWPLTAAGGWLMRSDLRYLRTILESDSGGRDLDLDPLLLSVGVGYRL